MLLVFACLFFTLRCPHRDAVDMLLLLRCVAYTRKAKVRITYFLIIPSNHFFYSNHSSNQCSLFESSFESFCSRPKCIRIARFYVRIIFRKSVESFRIMSHTQCIGISIVGGAPLFVFTLVVLVLSICILMCILIAIITIMSVLFILLSLLC